MEKLSPPSLPDNHFPYIHPPPTYEPVEEVGRIEGTVIAVGDEELFGRRELVIELEEGERFKFFVTDQHGTYAHSGEVK